MRVAQPMLTAVERPFAEAVLQDVRDRNLGILPPNFRVASLKWVTWSLSSIGGKGASRLPMGRCS
jgi:hypothetical protein